MDKKAVIEAAAAAVLFALCLVMYILKRRPMAEGEPIKGQKRIKKLWFAGMLISGWFLIGIIISAATGLSGRLAIEFEMFSERTELFGISLAKTTLISCGVTLLLILLLLAFRLFAVPKFSADSPRGIQNVAELLIETVDGMVEKAVGESSARQLSPYMLTVGIFMIGCALTELLGLRAPTSDLTCTFAMGLITFILLNVYGIKKHGVLGRLKSMGGAVPAMRPLMIPLKAVSDIAVPVSLACRLFGNMLGGMLVMELLKGVLGGYASGLPAIAGLYFNLFHPLIQMYIFITLSLTFINEAQE